MLHRCLSSRSLQELRTARRTWSYTMFLIEDSKRSKLRPAIADRLLSSRSVSELHPIPQQTKETRHTCSPHMHTNTHTHACNAAHRRRRRSWWRKRSVTLGWNKDNARQLHSCTLNTASAFALFPHTRPTRTAPVSKISTTAAPDLPSSAIFLTSLPQLHLQPKLMLH